VADRTVVWSRRAKLDLLEMWAYLAARESDEIADAQVGKLQRLGQSLERGTIRGRPRDELRPGLRSLLSPPYLIFFAVSNDVVEIARVIHGSRNLLAALGGDNPQ
jgi:toxin ParE1/3/4